MGNQNGATVPTNSVVGEQSVNLVLPSLNQRTRKFGSELNDYESELFKRVKNDSWTEVQDYLRAKGDEIDLNKKDPELCTILQIAVGRKDLEMVKGLVELGCDDEYALRLAGAMHLTDMMKILCKVESDEIDGQQQNRSSRTDLRPLKEAVDAENYSLTKKLIDNLPKNISEALTMPAQQPTGHCQNPLWPIFLCKTENTNQTTEEESEENTNQTTEEEIDFLDVYHIRSSASYILVTASDPIDEALRTAKDLNMLARRNPEHRPQLLQWAKRSSKLAIDLLATCNNVDDVEVLINPLHEVNSNARPFSKKRKRLHDAIDVRHKEFVASPACQQLISKLWLRPILYIRWRKYSTFQRIWHILLNILLTPVIFFLCLIKGFSKNSVDIPLNRFIYAATSYVFFLVNIAANQYRDRATNSSLDWYDWIIVFLMTDQICKIITDFITQWPYSYKPLWCIYDAIMMTFFFSGLITFIVAYEKTDNWQLVLVSQGLYAIAMTLAFIRILQWFHLSSRIGPLVISFGNMAEILLNFLSIFTIVLLAFSVGIYTVYRNFQTDSPVDEKERTFNFFSGYINTLATLVWAIFGKGESSYASVPDQYYYFVRNINVTSNFQDTFTINAGYILWSCFHLAVVVVLLNMLIALVTQYYQSIQENRDVEWKFACTKLQMYYIENTYMMFPPGNIITLVLILTSNLLACFEKNEATDAKTADDKFKEVVERMIERYRQEKKLAKIVEREE